jgi:hypothetical protein
VDLVSFGTLVAFMECFFAVVNITNPSTDVQSTPCPYSQHHRCPLTLETTLKQLAYSHAL